MTIAAGFRCKDGIVLCADTEITLSVGKTYESKIFYPSERLGCHLTYCGSADFAKELVGDLQRTLASTTEDTALSVIKNAYKELFDQSCDPNDVNTWTSILVTLREKVNGKDRVNLYAGRGRHFAPESRYATLGIGQDQSESLFNPLYSQDMTITQAIYMSIYALHLVKGFVPGCGGETQYTELLDDRDLISFGPLFRPQVKDVEKDLVFLSNAFRPVLLTFADLELEVETGAFHAAFREMGKRLKEYRKKRVKAFQAEQRRFTESG